MRIIYGAFAQGQGHFSKAAVLVPQLEAWGHEVRVISSGWDTPPPGYQFRWHRHFPGMSYVVTKGRTDPLRTTWKWIRESPRVFANVWKLRRIVREFQPDLIISDFEPLTASPFLRPPCEVVALSRQVAMYDPAIPLPPAGWLDETLTRTVIRMFTAGADRRHGYHYAPASPQCVPPVVRPELRHARPELGEHLLVYNHYCATDGGEPDALIAWAERRRVPVRVYGLPQVPRGRHGLVDFRAPAPQGMVEDMRTARAVITSAGLTTPLEAFLLGKPVCVVPIPGHWEQVVNAFHLSEAGLVRWCRTWDYDAATEQPAPAADHPLAGWLNNSPAAILRHVLAKGSAGELVRGPGSGRRAA